MTPNSVQLVVLPSGKMPLEIVAAKVIKGCGVIVSFSDETQAAYPAEELGELRPYRAPMERKPQC